MWEKLKNDSEMQLAVQANIAMAFKDMAHLWKAKKKLRELTSEDLHIISNAAASWFVDVVCDNKPFESNGDGLAKHIGNLEHYLKQEEDSLRGANSTNLKD